MRYKLTEKFVAEMEPPPKGQRIVFADVPGFGFRCTAGNVRSFIYNYRFQGVDRRHKIGSYPAWTVLAAREEALRLRQLVERGIDPQQERQNERAAPTVKQLADDYLERHAKPHKRPLSVRDDVYMLDGIIRPQLSGRTVESITRRDIESLHGSLSATPYKANRVLALLSKMFALAMEWEWRTDNPAKNIPKFHEDKREKWLTTIELKRLLRALREHSAKGTVNAILLLIYTGARRGEVLSATWSQFDLKRGVWTKPASTTKQKRVEHIPLNRGAIRLLKSMKKKGDYLFPSDSEEGHLTDIKTVWKSVCTTAKLKGVRLHDLRHSFASHLVSSGVSLQMVGKLLGHSSPQTTARYAHLADDPLRDATNKFPKLT